MEINIISLSCHGDDRGSLVSLESHKNIPFDIKRVYYIFDTQKEVVRGLHAHKALEQVAVCIKGSCKFVLNDGVVTKEVLLDDPAKGLYIGNMIWREMHSFSEDCVLLVLASAHYDECDYIRDYNIFIENTRTNK